MMTGKDWKDCRILVTGGAGFIGSALVWAINRKGGDKIVICDRLGKTEKWQNLLGLKFEDYYETVHLDGLLKSGKLGKFDLVLHFGGTSSTSENDASYLIENNYTFTKTLAEWAMANRVRFVYASSAATYGNGTSEMIDDDAQLDRLRPLNMYAYSKHIFDQYAERTGILRNSVGLKLFNVFGPNENHKGDMKSLVAKVIGQGDQDGCIKLFKSYNESYKDGEQKRDFLYVKDAVEMILHLAGCERAVGVYNLGSGTARTWLDLAHAVFFALGRDPKIEFIDMPPYMKKGYQYFTCANISKLRDSGYKCEISSLEHSVADYVTNYVVKGRHLAD